MLLRRHTLVLKLFEDLQARSKISQDELMDLRMEGRTRPLIEISTVKPRYSALQGTGQNYALFRGSLYCQYINNSENTSWD